MPGISLKPQPPDAVPDQGTTIAVGQDSRLALSPQLQDPVLSPFPNVRFNYLFVNQLIHLQTLNLIEGRRVEQVSSSVDQNASQFIVNRSSMEESERNVATGSYHGDRTPSKPELPEPSKEKVVPEDKAEDVGRTPTSTRKAIKELLVFLRARELRENGIQGNVHSSPHPGAEYFPYPYSNPTAMSDVAHSSHGTSTSECKMPQMIATKVHHHHHYHYNVPNISTPPGPPIINKNIIRINNKNTSNGLNSSESGDDEGEH